MINTLILIGVIVCVLSLVFSVSIIRKQQNNVWNKQDNPTVKHPIIANPIIIAYILFPIIVIVGAIIWRLLES